MGAHLCPGTWLPVRRNVGGVNLFSKKKTEKLKTKQKSKIRINQALH